MLKQRTKNSIKKIQRLTTICLIYCTISSSKKYSLKFQVSVWWKILPCNKQKEAYIYVARIKEGENKRIAFKLARDYSKEPPAKQFISKEDQPDQSMYALYDVGGVCMEIEPNTPNNAAPFLALLIQKRKDDSRMCEVVKIITNTGLKPCSSTETVQLWDIITFGKTTDDEVYSKFRIFQLPQDYLVEWYRDSLLISEDFDFVNFDPKLVDLMLVSPIGRPQPTEPDVLEINHSMILDLKSYKDHNNEVGKLPTAVQIGRRLVKGDLPGYFLEDRDGVSDTDFSKHFHFLNRGYHTYARTQKLVFYISDHSKLMLNQEYEIMFKSTPFRMNSKQELNLATLNYRINVKRTRAQTSSKVIFELLRRGDKSGFEEALKIELTDPEEGNFVYFGVMVGQGVLYLEDEAGMARIRTYETFFAYDGKTRRTSTSFNDAKASLLSLIAIDKDQAKQRYTFIKYMCTKDKANKPGFRVYSSMTIIGVYPPHLIAKDHMDLDEFPDCFLPDYNKNLCHRYATILRPDHTPGNVIFSQKKNDVKKLTEKVKNNQMCLFKKYEYKCLIPKDGSIVNLEYHESNRMHDRIMLLKKFDLFDQENKDYFYEFENDKKRRYVISCFGSCKFVSYLSDTLFIFSLIDF